MSSNESNSDGETVPKPVWIPRVIQNNYKKVNEKQMKEQKGKLKFTKGTHPDMIQKLKHLIDDSVACPSFLPMEEEDTIMTPAAI
jgi:hypothetical protein